MNKTITYISMAIFSTLFGFIPFIWGDGFLSFSSLIANAIGAFFGIWVSYKIQK